MPNRHIRKSTISELYEFFWRYAHIRFRSPPWPQDMLSPRGSVGTHYCVLDVNFRNV